MGLIRHCVQCGIDYRPEIVYCADCGGELETREEEDPRFAPPPRPELPFPTPELPPGEYRSVYFTYDVVHLRPLMEALADRGIPYRVDTTPLDSSGRHHHKRYDLCVREEERAAAREELSRLPGADLSLEQVEALDKDFDPERGYSHCPACSSSLSLGSRSCPECGLALQMEAEGATCSECGKDVGAAEESCPYCGVRFEE